MTRAHVRRLSWSVVLLLATHAYAQQTAAPVFPNPGKTSMSKDNQRALGMEVAGQVYEQMPVLPDNSPESQYIRQLGQKLVATIPENLSKGRRAECRRSRREPQRSTRARRT